MAGQGTWFPELRTNDYWGKEIDHRADFFAPPPQEIGEVVVAHTDLQLGMSPGPVTRVRVTRTLLAALAMSFICWLFSLADWKPEQLPALYSWLAVAIGVAAWVAWASNKPRYVCSYVGKLGAARFECSGSRDRLIRSEVFLFQNATEVRTMLRNIHVNGCYVNTQYSFTWRNAAHKVVYRLGGVHHTQNQHTSSHEDFTFGRATEEVWTQYLSSQAYDRVFRDSQTLEFRVRSRGRIAVSKHYLELGRKRLEVARLSPLIDRGIIYLVPRGKKRKWYLPDRWPSVRYADVSNALLFAWLLNDLTGCEATLANLASRHGYHVLHSGSGT